MDPLAALAGGAAPSSPSASTAPVPESPDAMGTPGEQTPEDEDKMMLIEDFRQAPPEDALSAFEALLSAFNVKRS